MQNADVLQISREVSGCSYVICSTLFDRVELPGNVLGVKSDHLIMILNSILQLLYNCWILSTEIQFYLCLSIT